jgi:hypothetical protein
LYGKWGGYMREIKFRAWDNSDKNWEKMVYFEFGKISGDDVDGNIWNNNDEPIGDYIGNYNKRDEFIIMQFTGLKDKNGKEIYEGDILEIIVPDDDTYYREVTYSDGWGAFIVYFDFGEGDVMDLGCALEDFEAGDYVVKVIGNIWENGELLK